MRFFKSAIGAVRKGLSRTAGALGGGLRSILEATLNEIMYSIPSEDSVSRVVIDENVIAGSAEPMLIYENQEQRASSE